MSECFKISIIVPVYNSEKYLRRCIESILSQSYANLELILINDGSTDESELICKYFVSNDSRVAYYSQENKGPSAARNFGLCHASGNYLLFVDSDDYLNYDSVQTFVNCLEDSDLVISGYTTHYSEEKNLKKTVTYAQSGYVERKLFDTNLNRLIDADMFHYLWNKLYSMQIINSNTIRFKDDLHIGEDFLFNLDYYQCISNLKIINEGTYNHCVYTLDSITRNYTKNQFKERKKIISYAFSSVESHHQECLISEIVNYLTVKLYVSFKYIYRTRPYLRSRERLNQIGALINDPIFSSEMLMYMGRNKRIPWAFRKAFLKKNLFLIDGFFCFEAIYSWIKLQIKKILILMS